MLVLKKEVEKSNSFLINQHFLFKHSLLRTEEKNLGSDFFYTFNFENKIVNKDPINYIKKKNYRKANYIQKKNY
jgi:hypothetical protein